MTQTVRATYDAANKLLRLDKPLVGVPDGAMVFVTITTVYLADGSSVELDPMPPTLEQTP